jgi:hypothetical protein
MSAAADSFVITFAPNLTLDLTLTLTLITLTNPNPNSSPL